MAISPTADETIPPVPRLDLGAKSRADAGRSENIFSGLFHRILHSLAMALPGGGNLRIALHRLRGVKIGDGTWIGYQALIETAYPDLVTIGKNVVIGVRSTIIAHFQEQQGVTIHDDVYIGACAVILPGVTIGRGAVISAGSVVTTSVPPMTVVQGNPAKRIARCGIPLGLNTTRAEFTRQLTRIE